MIVLTCSYPLLLYPHCGQKAALAGSLEPQLAQLSTIPIAVPHAWQNLAPCMVGLEHLGQLTPAKETAGFSGNCWFKENGELTGAWFWFCW
jgi:hypothetical protein